MKGRQVRFDMIERHDSDYEPRNIGHFLDPYFCPFIGLVAVIGIIWLIIQL